MSLRVREESERERESERMRGISNHPRGRSRVTSELETFVPVPEEDYNYIHILWE